MLRCFGPYSDTKLAKLAPDGLVAKAYEKVRPAAHADEVGAGRTVA